MNQQGWSALLQLPQLRYLMLQEIIGLTHISGPDNGPVFRLDMRNVCDERNSG